MAKLPAIPLPLADRFAAEALDLLRDACEVLVVAGSIRRRRVEVHDVELVGVPRYAEVKVPSLFDDLPPERVNQLTVRLRELRKAGVICPWAGAAADWPPPNHIRVWYIATVDGVRAEVPLDLFVGERDEFGARLAIRTGPHAYSQQLVTPRGKQAHIHLDNDELVLKPGLLKAGLSVKACRVWGGDGRAIPTPTEEEFFRVIGQPWLEPSKRR